MKGRLRFSILLESLHHLLLIIRNDVPPSVMFSNERVMFATSAHLHPLMYVWKSVFSRKFMSIINCGCDTINMALHVYRYRDPITWIVYTDAVLIKIKK